MKSTTIHKIGIASQIGRYNDGVSMMPQPLYLSTTLQGQPPMQIVQSDTALLR